MYENHFYRLEAGDRLSYLVKTSGREISIEFPKFHIDGEDSGLPSRLKADGSIPLNEGEALLTWTGCYACGAKLRLEAKVQEKSPFVRFRYVLWAESPLCLTKPQGHDQVTYLAYTSPNEAVRTEVRLSDYDFRLHSYCLSELPAFAREPNAMGPILVEEWGATAMLTAYEHGSQYPDKFLAYYPQRDGCGVSLRAVKGNTWQGQSLQNEPYETVWFQLGAVRGDINCLAKAYREFQLKYCCANGESRKPYIFYNTWAFQERNKFYNQAAYLDSMNYNRICQEIDIAHQLGVDVFVIDTGWYRKTGDWQVDLERFPDGLKEVKEKLTGYGMKLGLWFNPTVAAKSSQLLAENQDTIAEKRGQPPQAFPIWETEESYPMCIVSHAWEAFANQLIRLYRELGVTYFKWDAVDLYGCESGGHFHGGPESSAQESGECYAFLIGRYLTKIVEKLSEECPEAIVDMDITECRRYFGLGFLSAGKFFAVNNGPYFQDYDIQPPENVWINALVHPGPARARICRGVLDYDKWVPSVLMMTHYLPDDPESSQLLNLASLILGQNGVWGDLPKVSEKGRALFSQVIAAYKQVREDITAAYPVRLGKQGSTFEVYEKINQATGKGVVCLFGSTGQYQYCLENPGAGEAKVFGSARVTENGDIEVSFQETGAAIVFFGCT